MIRQPRPWKAMILAAGFGTRLLPYTEHTPKAMFPIDGQPNIDRTIRYLIDGGCAAILINTHHLHNQIEAFVAAGKYSIPVQTRYEPEILGTGGGIKNAADFFGRQPFVVLNSDIITDIPLNKLYAFHCSHPDSVTMVLFNDPQLNTVRVDSDFRVLGFDQPTTDTLIKKHRQFTFTGIQVLDPDVLDHIPAGVFSSSIDTYRRLIDSGRTIRAYMAGNCQWQDIGTPESYRNEVFRKIAPQAFARAFGTSKENKIKQKRMVGDGSDRRWYRLTTGGESLIMADHGIRTGDGPLEVDAFIDIGRHLHHQKVALPELVAWDCFAGLVLMEDLGDVNLQLLVRKAADSDRIEALYQTVIKEWVRLSTKGYDGFDPSWAFQTRCYDRELILERECRYFVDAFLNGYLNMAVDYTAYQSEFEYLAERILTYAIDGLIHRDCQSRNIMVKEGRFYFIDFQGARPGPVQYDLASLLIDPYVALPSELQERMLEYGFEQFARAQSINRQRFFSGYRYCALSRNLQILGAFGFLTQVKDKPYFKNYIPMAVQSLTRCLDAFNKDEFPSLKSVAESSKRIYQAQ